MFTQVLIAALAIVVAVALWLALRWYGADQAADRLSEQARRGAAMLDCVAGGYLTWADGEGDPVGNGRGETASPSLTALLGDRHASLAGLMALFDPATVARLDNLVEALHGRGEEFSETLATADRTRTFRLDGRRARTAAVDLLWVTDVTNEVSGTRATASRLQQAEAERAGLEAMLDGLPIPVWRRAANLALVQVNRAYRAAVNSETEQVLGSQLELGFAGDPDNPGNPVARLASGTGSRHSESAHVVVGSERRLLELNEVPGASGIIGYAVDHTEMEDLQTDMARHIAAHADVLENFAAAVAIYGRDTRLQFYNAAYALLWDHDRRFLDGQPSLGEELERLRERRRLPEYIDFRAFKDEEMVLFTSLIDAREDLVHLPDGRTLRKRVVPHPLGGLLFTYEDVTDSLSLERNYNMLIEVQRRTLDNLYEGVALIGSDGRLKLCNSAYGRVWQLAEADLDGEPHIVDLIDKCRDFYDSDEPWPDLRERIIAAATSREPHTGRIERADGSVVEYATVPMPDGMVLLSYIDVTDRYRVERALRERTEALEAADNLKTEFIANVSYELRTPLNAISGFTQILNGEMFGVLNEKQHEYCAGILQSSDQLLDLINDILDLATIEAGFMELEPQRFDVHAMMAGVYAITRERARQQSLRLDLECATGIGVMTGDERRLKQVVFNLVSNAIKFTPAGGKITMAARREGDALVFAVSDSGVGIPHEDQSRVWRKFERGSDPMVRRVGSGAGLGLSLVQSFVELHGAARSRSNPRPITARS